MSLKARHDRVQDASPSTSLHSVFVPRTRKDTETHTTHPRSASTRTKRNGDTFREDTIRVDKDQMQRRHARRVIYTAEKHPLPHRDGRVAGVVRGGHERRDAVLVLRVDGHLDVLHQHANNGRVTSLGSLRKRVDRVVRSENRSAGQFGGYSFERLVGFDAESVEEAVMCVR